MSTTAIFVELLVSGIQASIWLALFVLSFTGLGWVTTVLPFLEKWETLATVLVFSSWYTLGIIVDRFARILFMVYDPAALLKKLAMTRKQVSKTAADPSRVEIAVKAGVAYEYLEYFRSRARIVRGAIFNAIMTSIAAIVFIHTQCGALNCTASIQQWTWGILTTGLLVVICGSIASGMLELAYKERAAQAKQALEKVEK